MIKIIQILTLSVILPILCSAQFSDNFNDGNLTDDPTWSGDIEKFKINDISELQLNDVDANTSLIHFPISLQSDFTWKFDFELSFNPSKNNLARIYLVIDNLDLTKASGYYVELGENGSEDAIKIFSLNSGTPELLATGKLGGVAFKPAFANVKIDRVGGNWTLSTDYSKQGILTEEVTFFDDTFNYLENGYFAIECKYTKSNITRMFFDNIVGENFKPDQKGPEFIENKIVNNSTVELTFNEPIKMSSIDTDKFDLSPSIPLNNVEVGGEFHNIITVTYAESFKSGVPYTLNVTGLTDKFDNKMEEVSINIEVSEPPTKGDLVINELLFDPNVGGQDFVEILNISKKLINLNGVTLLNAQKGGSEEVIEEDVLLRPQQLIAITKDVDVVKEQYFPPSESYFYEFKIPSMNKDEGNLTILDLDGEVIDSYDYSDEHHVSLLDDVKGVSLERIYPQTETIPINFSSGVASTKYATPGYPNANTRINETVAEGLLTLESTVFSPNPLDGDRDQLIMFLKMPDVGYYTTIKVFNIAGQLIKTIQNNTLTGLEDLVKWDGTLDDGGKAPVGHYIIALEAFDQKGSVKKAKKHVKLVDAF